MGSGIKAVWNAISIVIESCVKTAVVLVYPVDVFLVDVVVAVMIEIRVVRMAIAIPID